MLPQLNDDVVRKIFTYKFKSEAYDERQLGTRWKIRTSDGRLRFPKKPIYDRYSARLYDIRPTFQASWQFLSALDSDQDPHGVLDGIY